MHLNAKLSVPLCYCPGDLCNLSHVHLVFRHVQKARENARYAVSSDFDKRDACVSLT